MMEAKDTVRLCNPTSSGWRINCDAKCHNDQAEISFKAGEDKGYAQARQHCEDVIIPQAEAQARREVVECCEEGKITTDVFQEDGSLILRKGDIIMPQLYWQIKRKEWEIK